MAFDPPRARILVADDDAALVEALSLLLEAEGHEALRAADGESALRVIRSERPDLAFLDLRMPGRATIEVLPEIAAVDPALPVVIVTGYGTIELTVAAMRAGAYDFLEKPVRRDVLQPLLARALEHRRLRRELARLRDARGLRGIGALSGESAAMARLREDVERVAAATHATALVLGESGSGKELVARALHGCSARADGPWVAVNCAALAGPLLEAELFGYVRGSFTGADPAGREGLFEQAHGGTLFLDEVGELDPALQAKLLRVLEDRRVRRIGGSGDRAVDVRIVAASNRDVRAEVSRGSFREDLYYRLAVVTLRVPPLRERGDDVWHLARLFLAELHPRGPIDFDPDAEAALRAHAWPGNVRELRNAVERAVIVCRDARIGVADLALGGHSAAAAPAVRPLADAERDLIEAALRQCGGNVSHAAKALGIHRTTLHRKLDLLRRNGSGGENPEPSQRTAT